MHERIERKVEKSQVVKDVEARITAEEQAMTPGDREARVQRVTEAVERKSIFGWRG